MCYKLYIAIKDDEKNKFFFSLNSFNKDLYNRFHFQRVQKYELFLFKKFIYHDYNVLI